MSDLDLINLGVIVHLGLTTTMEPLGLPKVANCFVKILMLVPGSIGSEIWTNVGSKLEKELELSNNQEMSLDQDLA